jgi:hypothetical protein
MTYLTGWRLALRRYVRGGNAHARASVMRSSEHPAAPVRVRDGINHADDQRTCPVRLLDLDLDLLTGFERVSTR